MARFTSTDENEIFALETYATNSNTQHSTNVWMRVLQAWANEKDFLPDVTIYAPEDLNNLLKRFYIIFSR